MNIHPVAGTETGKGWKFACLSGNVRCDRKEEGNTVLVECLRWGRSAWKCQTPWTKPALWINTKVLKVAPPPWKPGLTGATSCSIALGGACSTHKRGGLYDQPSSTRRKEELGIRCQTPSAVIAPRIKTRLQKQSACPF